MEFIVNLTYLPLFAYLSLRKPTFFVCAYILYYTQFLGFISNQLLIAGVDFGAILFNCTLLLSLFIKTPYVKEWDGTSKITIAFFASFFLYGIFKPVLDGNQNIVFGIKASKSFLPYVFLVYLILYRKHIAFEKVFNWILTISLYFSILYIINASGIRIVPPCYVKHDFIQCSFDSFYPFSIAVLLYYKYIGKDVAFYYPKIILLLIGIIIGGYFSIAATTILLLIVIYFHRRVASITDYIFIGLFALFYLYVVFVIIEQTEWYVELQRSQMNALITRERYNEFRWKIIEQHIWIGAGFLYKTSMIVKSYASTGYRETFTFIDAGYVDLLGRFGLCGVFLFLAYPFTILVRSLKIKYLFPFSAFIFQFFCVNYTWAVFSYPMGILVLSLSYAFIMQELKK